MQLTRKNISGFALLEVVAALAIITVIFGASLFWVQRSERKNQAQVIAQEFNMILGASQAYYEDMSGHWPNDGFLNSQSELIKGYYLPIDKTLSHFEQSYFLKTNRDSQGDIISFQVSLCAPSAWAHLIAPLLPYGHVDPSQCSNGYGNVIAEISGKMKGLNKTHFYLRYPGGKVPIPNCDPNDTAVIYNTLMGFDSNGKPFSMFRVMPSSDLDNKNWTLHLSYMASDSIIHSDENHNLEGVEKDNKSYPIFVVTGCENKNNP